MFDYMGILSLVFTLLWRWGTGCFRVSKTLYPHQMGEVCVYVILMPMSIRELVFSSSSC